jgi:hypothetical protein
MNLTIQTPKKAFLKQKPLRSEIDIFKQNLTALLDRSLTEQSRKLLNRTAGYNALNSRELGRPGDWF